MSQHRSSRVALLALDRELRLHVYLGVQTTHERNGCDTDGEHRCNNHDHDQSENQEPCQLEKGEQGVGDLSIDWIYVNMPSGS